MGAGKGDLGLDGAGTLSQGTRLKNAADDLDSVGRLLGAGPASQIYAITNIFGDEKFGEYGADTAFPSFSNAWNEEVGVLAEALRELHRKIGDGVATTRAEDVREGEGFRSIESPSKGGPR
ncbi:hypothetical protein [Streptomyces albidus (ex Kaewkla and Franco 2022)]|uniref:hypothetical protein n=1 Tax=Streptomyces albidus (ex Kaewkla and Franco 2022) TaxID=722709 RepID=UPI0015EF7DCB|nr:hypothetical protein [Streptomyces albidus (ex Kaewkla and Franco 2022)]